MKPLINLKSFLAVLLILIVPAALLVAYFRNYSPEGASHEAHGEKGKSGGSAMSNSGDTNAATGHGNMAMPQGGQPQPQALSAKSKKDHQPPAAQSQQAGGHAAAGHGNMAQPATAQAHPQPAPAPPKPGAASAREQPSIATLGTSPGIPGASHLYHLGAAGFFLDHTQHLTLNIEQKKKLNQIEEQAALNKASANRKVQEAEQQLWKLTAVKKPDTALIETKVREIEKLHVAQRLAFIRSVGEAAKVLTEEQTKILLGDVASVMPDAKPATESAHQHKP